MSNLQNVVPGMIPYVQDHSDGDPTVYLKIVTPNAYWCWYITEARKDGLCFGYEVGPESGWRFFYLSELEERAARNDLKLELATNWEPKPWSVVCRQEGIDERQ